jgi:predicted metal-dependent hydrolase
MATAAGKTGGGAGKDGVIVEFHRIGNAIKVSAVETSTYLEVSIVAPAHATEREMTDLVLKKLAWVKAKGAAKPPGRR